MSAGDSPWIIDATEQNFESLVLERSQEVPVVIDFWATWCGPCLELGPVLEKLAREYAGKFLLIKVDVDKLQGIAQAFGIYSIPHVFAFRKGQPVSQFQGVVPEDQLRRWLDQLLPSKVEQLIIDAERLESSDPGGAEARFREALELDPQQDLVKIRLAKTLLAQHKDQECREMLDSLEARGFLEPEAQDLKAELELRAAAAEAGDVEACRAAVAANPSDLGLQLKLAESLVAVKKYDEALDICLNIVERDKAGVGQQARDVMVNMFHLLGPASHLTGTYRRKLATLLY